MRLIHYPLMSWVDIINTESTTCVEKHFIAETLSSNVILSLDEILSNEYQHLETLKILEYQMMILFNLKKNLKLGNSNNIEFIKKCLNWLYNTNKQLSVKFNLTQIQHKMPNWALGNIPRSSYKFCDHNYECSFYYKNKQCYAHHYVFNIVMADIDILMKYIEYVQHIKGTINDIELLKCFNTLSFVVTHMYDEASDVKEKGLWNTKKI